jgi:hypothetical protein
LNIEDWFKSKNFVWDEKRKRWCIAWDKRSGHDFTDLEFQYEGPHANQWYAIVGHHASGTNPRMHIDIGVCESMEDIERTYNAIRLINGYPHPEEPGH